MEKATDETFVIHDCPEFESYVNVEGFDNLFSIRFFNRILILNPCFLIVFFSENYLTDTVTNSIWVCSCQKCYVKDVVILLTTASAHAHIVAKHLFAIVVVGETLLQAAENVRIQI